MVTVFNQQEMAKAILAHPELSEGMGQVHIELLAGILECGITDYPVLASESWVMEQVSQSFSGRGTLQSQYDNPAFAYLQAAIAAAQIL